MALSRSHATRIRRRRAGLTTGAVAVVVAVVSAGALTAGNALPTAVKTVPAHDPAVADVTGDGRAPAIDTVIAGDDSAGPPPRVGSVTGTVEHVLDIVAPAPPAPRRVQSTSSLQDVVDDPAGDVSSGSSAEVAGRSPDGVPVDEPSLDLRHGGIAFDGEVLTLRSTLDDLGDVGAAPTAGERRSLRSYTVYFAAGGRSYTVTAVERPDAAGMVFTARASVAWHGEPDRTDNAYTQSPSTEVSGSVDAASKTVSISVPLTALNDLRSQADEAEGTPTATLAAGSELTHLHWQSMRRSHSVDLVSYQDAGDDAPSGVTYVL